MPDVKPYSVSYTKLHAWRRCRQQYHWKYINKYFPPSSVGQMRGTAGHAALGSWHQQYDSVLALDAAWDTWSGAGYADGDDWRQLETALNRYFSWSLLNDTFKLVVAEQRFDIDYTVSIAVPYPNLPAGDYAVTLTGYIDGIVTEDGLVWLLENKFYKKMDNSSLDMDNQVSIYLLASMLLGHDVKGTIYNIIRVGDSKIAEIEPAVRRRVHRNPLGLQTIQQEMLVQVQEMLRYEKEGGVPYRSPTKDCSWDCSFYAACLSMTDDGQEPTQLLQTLAQVRKDEHVAQEESK